MSPGGYLPDINLFPVLNLQAAKQDLPVCNLYIVCHNDFCEDLQDKQINALNECTGFKTKY